MWVVVLLLFLLLPLPLSVHAEDLGELSANPARLSGFSGLFSSSGFLISVVFRSANPLNETNRTNQIPVLVSANQTDQIDQINEIDQFRLSVLTGLDQQPLRRRESLQPQSHESLRPQPQIEGR